MQLNPADAGALAQIRQAVRQHIRADALRSMCEAIAQHVEETSLPFTYAGILLASGDRIGDAIEMLRLPPDLPFNQVLADYLEARQDFQPATTTFQQTAPYDIWTRTTIYQNYLDSTLSAFEAFARRTPPPGDQACPTLVDIGPGNGVLLVAMIKRLRRKSRSGSSLHPSLCIICQEKSRFPRSRNSPAWGHPAFSQMPTATMIVRSRTARN
jgi:hypothetical protein